MCNISVKASAHSFKRFTSQLLKLSFSLSLSLCTYIPRVDVMLDFICMEPQERVESDKIQNEKFLLTVGLEPTTLSFEV